MAKLLGPLVLTGGIYTLTIGSDLFAGLGMIVVGIAISLAAFQSK